MVRETNAIRPHPASVRCPTLAGFRQNRVPHVPARPPRRFCSDVRGHRVSGGLLRLRNLMGLFSRLPRPPYQCQMLARLVVETLARVPFGKQNVTIAPRTLLVTNATNDVDQHCRRDCIRAAISLHREHWATEEQMKSPVAT